MTGDSAQESALEAAASLVAAGVPVFAAPPVLDGAGEWDPSGGCGGYRLPDRWQATEASTDELGRWHPGWALCAVMGHTVDGLDVDPRNGGSTTLAGWASGGLVPTNYGAASTPSGGQHFLIAPLGAGSRDGVAPGVDIKSGRPDGTGRGFLFIAPTVKLSKSTGELRAYRWEVPPFLADLDTADDSGMWLAERIRLSRAATKGGDEVRAADRAVFDELSETERSRVNAYLAGVVRAIGSDLVAASRWQVGERDDRGRGWQKITADAAYRLGSLVRAPWTPWGPADGWAEFCRVVPASIAAAVALPVEWARQSGRGPAAHFPPAPFGNFAPTVRNQTVDGGPADSTGCSRDEAESKHSAVARLVDMMEARYSFGVTLDRNPFALPHGRHVMMPIGQHLSDEITLACFRSNGSVPSDTTMKAALAVVSATARASTPRRAAQRVAEHDGALWIDLGGTGHEVVRLDDQGWSIEPTSPAMFSRSALTKPLPEPCRGGNLGALWDLLNVAPASQGIYLGWLVCTLGFPDMEHPILTFTGEQGTGKTSATRATTRLVDPSNPDMHAPPRDATRWEMTAGGSYVVALDNMSSISPQMSDMLCRAVTGEGFVNRKLYTDKELVVSQFRSALIINGINLGSIPGDLAERILSVRLTTIAPNGRRSASELERLWDERRPAILGALLDTVAKVRDGLPSVKVGELPRMADFGRVLATLDSINDSNSLGEYLAAGNDTATESLRSFEFTDCLMDSLTDEFSGPVAELLKVIAPDPAPKWWPSPKKAAMDLDRAAPQLRRLGWVVETQWDKRNRRRIWNIDPRAASLPTDNRADERDSPEPRELFPGSGLCSSCGEPLASHRGNTPRCRAWHLDGQGDAA